MNRDFSNDRGYSKRYTGARTESDCRQCRQASQELRELRREVENLAESRESFKYISTDRAEVIAAAIEIMTGVRGGRAMDLIRLANAIRERYGELPAEWLEEDGG